GSPNLTGDLRQGYPWRSPMRADSALPRSAVSVAFLVESAWSSDGLSIQHRRITKSCFRTCSSHGTRSQAPFYLYARNPIADRVGGSFELLRYRLGGDRPSQTAHLALSAVRVHGSGLEFEHGKGGVSLVGSPGTGIPGSPPPTYATHAGPEPNTKLQ